MKRRIQRGFSLIELLIVVSIMMVLAGMAVPYLLRARQNAYEVSAVGFLRALQAAQITYRTSNGVYATSFDQLPELAVTPLTAGSNLNSSGNLLGNQGSGQGQGFSQGQHASGGSGGSTSEAVRSSFIFTLTTVSADQWNCTADPLFDRSSGHFFYTDDTAAIRVERGATASASSSVIQ